MPSARVPQVLRRDDFSSGMIDDLSVSDALMPRNGVRKAVNVIFDRPRGSVSQRLGTTMLGSAAVSASNTILGLYNFRMTAGTDHQMLAAVNGSVYYLAGSNNWTQTLTSLDPSAKCRFITFCDRVACLNGVDSIRSWNGSTAWITSGGALDEANFPITKYAALLNGRLACAGNSTYPCRLYESSIVSTSITISWTSGNKNTDVFPNDGNGKITSLIGNGKMVLIFKDRGLYRYDDNELQHIVNIGTPSHESVFTDDNGISYFFGQGANTVGFYMTTGGYPRKISRAITKWVEAISPSFYSSVNGYTDGQKCYWSIGSVTIDDITYSNAWLVYSISDQTWEARNYADRFTVFSQYITSTGAMTVVGGDTDGMVQTINSGNTDDGTAIYSECEFAKEYLTGRGETKIVNEIVVLASDYQGLNMYMAVDNDDFKLLGSVENMEQKISLNLKGHAFQPKIAAINSGVPFVFDGFEYIDVTTEGYSL